MDERDYKAMNRELNQPLQQCSVVRSFLEDCVYYDLYNREMCPNKDVCVLCSSKPVVYKFEILNKNGYLFKSEIPCENDTEAENIKLQILKSKNVKSVYYTSLK